MELTCTFCGGSIVIEEYYPNPYDPDSASHMIVCYNSSCGAEWSCYGEVTREGKKND